MVYVVTDWHLGHKNITNFRPEFSSSAEHDAHIIMHHAQLVTKRDITYFLGDIAFTPEALRLVAGLKGEKRLVLGNHDTDQKLDIRDLVQVYDRVSALESRKGVWLSHCPIHPVELRGKPNMHGHVHLQGIPDERYLNCCPENIGYAPVDFFALRSILIKD